LYPDVDFYTGVIYKAMGFPTKECSTVLFAIGRLPDGLRTGVKPVRTPATKIGRPQQVLHRPGGTPVPHSLREVQARLGRAPRWFALVGIIVASRLVSTVMMLWFANGEAENPWTAEKPDLFEFSRIWDSHWYRIISGNGISVSVTHWRRQSVGESAWAFMPVYPILVRVGMGLTGAPFALVSVAISTLAFAMFVVVADRFFRRIVGDSASLFRARGDLPFHRSRRFTSRLRGVTGHVVSCRCHGRDWPNGAGC